MNDTISPAFFNFVSQAAHCATTYAITFTVYAKWGFDGWIISAILVLIYAAIHEFIWDPREENAATRGSDVEDFSFLVAGPLLALVIGHYLCSWKI
jgi:hypothetical protein